MEHAHLTAKAAALRVPTIATKAAAKQGRTGAFRSTALVESGHAVFGVCVKLEFTKGWLSLWLSLST